MRTTVWFVVCVVRCTAVTCTVLHHRVMPIRTRDDIILVRNHVRDLAHASRFDSFGTVAVITASSEIARNTLVHGLGGHAHLEQIARYGRVGVRALFRDAGPGIRDVALALAGGHSTRGSLGLGLSGSRRLVDEFDVESTQGGRDHRPLRQMGRREPVSGAPESGAARASRVHRRGRRLVYLYETVSQARHRARKALVEAAARHCREGVSTSLTLEDGAPWAVIVRIAKEQDVDMIVLGAGGHHTHRHRLLGGVADRVLRMAPCPVLTVPNAGRVDARAWA
jgi:serine/threonine-protein kinase RsbT